MSLSSATSATPQDSNKDLSATNGEDEIPPLSFITTEPGTEDRIAALRLVADSVAQQRQTASRIIILHPVVLALAVAAIAILSQYAELATVLTTGTGILMTGMLGVRLITAGYISLAEEVGPKWLQEYGKQGASGSPAGNGTGNGSREPVVVAAKFGKEVIGALVMRVVKRERKGYVKAWTVKLRYRHKGIGRGLLEEAAKIVWGRGGRGMAFEDDHANSARILPDFLNGAFDRKEVKGREMLAEVVAETRKERASR